jgi:Cucumopine synthase C-terminal helical bundle domain
LSHHLRFVWPQLEIAIRVVLLDDVNCDLSDKLWMASPFASIQSHAVGAGQQIYFPTRVVLPKPDAAFTEPMNKQSPGRVNFEPFFQYLSINYGSVSEAVPAWPIGQVVEKDVPLLAGLGTRVWENLIGRQSPLLVSVERADDRPQNIRLDDQAAAHRAIPLAATWQDLVAYLKIETDAIWLSEPEDVRALRLGVIASDAGVYGQYFSPWVMVTGLVRSLGVVELASLLRLSSNPTFTAVHLSTLLRELLSLSLGVIGYFGLPRLGATLQAVHACIGEIEQQSDFAQLLAVLLTYVNRYNQWLHLTFPWYLGVLFPKANVNDAQSIMNLSASPLFRRH